MIIMPVSGYDQLHCSAGVHSYSRKPRQARGRLAWAETRIHDNPFTVADVDEEALSVARAEDVEFRLVLGR